MIVKEQDTEDGDFPTVKSPNPEEKEGFSIAIEMAKKEKQTKIKSFAYKDVFIPQGGITELQNEYGVGCEEIEDYVKRVLI